MTQGPSTIEVIGEHEEDLAAHAVDLVMTIEGSSTFTGRSALKKAKEVAALVRELELLGMADSAVELEGVSMEVKSGLLGKSSSASYRLRLRVEDLEQLPAVLGAVSGSPQAKLEHLHWRYPDDAATEGRLLAAAAARAFTKAKAIAGALGVTIASISTAHEVQHRDTTSREFRVGITPMAARAQQEVDLGMQIQHRKKAKCEVRLSCVIAPVTTS